MIYQLKFYYGALVNGTAYYSIVSEFEDCIKAFKELPELSLKNTIKKSITDDGLNPEDFEIRFLTNEEYLNRNKEENIKTYIREGEGPVRMKE